MDIFKLFGRLIIESDEAIEGLEEAKKGAKEAGDEFEKADGKAKKLSDGFTVLKGVASNLVTEGIGKLCTAIGNFVTDGYEYSKQIEGYATSFEVMTGSEEKAIEMTERLQKIGANTPFEMPKLADTTQLLMNYGFTADEAIDRLMMLGDISQGNSEKMSRIAAAYGQMSSAGKVSLEDIKQMIEAGFNPLQEISQSTGESMESLYTRISDGTISVDEITDSMIRSTEEGGKYFGSMEQQSATLDGRLSTLKDTANESISNILAPLLQQLADEWLPKVTDAISMVDEKFTAVSNWITEHQGLFIALGTVIGIVTTALTAQAAVQAVQIAMNAAEVTSLGALIAAKTAAAVATTAALAPYLLITAAIAAVIAIIVLCVKHWDEIKAKVVEVANAISEKISQMRDAITQKFTEIKDNVSEKFQAMKESMGNIMQAAKDTISEKLSKIKSAYEEHGGGIKGIASAAIEGVKGYYTAGYTFIDKLTGGKLSEIVDKFKSKMADARDVVKNAIEKIKSFFNFNWELPKIKLPHFSISGSFSLNPPSIPKFSVSWYKKAYDEAMVLNDPTIFGFSAASGKMLGGGEGNGNEVVAGEEHLLNLIRSAIAEQNEALAYHLQQLNEMVADYFPQVIEAAGHDIVTNDGVIVARYAPMFNTALGKISKGKDRGR